MVDQDTIVCTTCNTVYVSAEPHCPVCGEANPLLTAGLLADDSAAEITPNQNWLRRRSGCLIIFLFMLFFILVIGGILLGGYEGLQERMARTQAEVEKHYQQALVHLENERTELAMAELELTLSLDPTHSQARETLENLKAQQAANIVDTIPTPTTVEVLLGRTDDLFDEAKALTQQGNWAEAIRVLTEIREIDPGYKINDVSEALYNANYELGLRLISEGKLAEAVVAFDEALVERPDDPLVTQEWEKVTLYLSLNPADPSNFEDNIVVLNRIYSRDSDFADVASLLYDTYKEYGDYLGSRGEWCLALPRYQEAAAILSGQQIDALVGEAESNCIAANQASALPTATATPVARRTNPTATPSQNATPPAAGESITGSGRGSIYFSRFNQQNMLWEIVAVSLADGSERVALSNGVQPAISYDGNLLAYHSKLDESVGLHVFNLVTGEDTRATTFAEDVLPHWNNSNQDFIFNSQRAGDRRWQIMVGFADGKGDAVVVLDGRTPASSTINDLIAYQGTDPQGNNPGIYVIPRQGGDPQRITGDESDRTPTFSPVNNRIVFMSTRSGNWDIWTVSAAGGSAKRLTASPANDGLPVWSPDGSQIAFVSDRDGSWGIYTTSASGGQAQKIADWGDDHPDWLMEQLGWGR